MVTKKWLVETATAQTIKVEHGFVWFGNRIRISIDDELIYERKPKFVDLGDEHRFKIENQVCIVRIIPRTFDFQYELWIDGKLQ